MSSTKPMMSESLVSDARHTFVELLKPACPNARSRKYHTWALIHTLVDLVESGTPEYEAILDIHRGAACFDSRRTLEHLLQNNGFSRRIAKSIALHGLRHIIDGSVSLPYKTQRDLDNQRKISR